MKTEEIIRLIKAVSDSSLTEFDYKNADTELHLKTATGDVLLTAGEVKSVAKASAPAQTEVDFDAEDDGNWVKSPLIGTFYSAPSEGAESFVSLGDQVKKGQVLGIIETMKLMNELESDRDGVITDINISNEQVVEYGQKLFRIEEA